MTQASERAVALLRDPANLQWYIVPLLAFVVYTYVAEARNKNWDIVLAGLLYCTAEFAWEMFNGLVLFFSGYAALWSAPSNNSYLIFVGLNVEIMFMFSIAGLILTKSLPEDKSEKMLGISSRILIPALFGGFCVFVEIMLNKAGLLVWDWWWWSWPHIYLILFVYIAPFYLLTWVHDNLSTGTKVKWLFGWIIFDSICWLIFVRWLGWI